MSVSKKTVILAIFAVAGFSSLLVIASSDSSCQSAWNQSEASSSCYVGNGDNSSAYVEWRSARNECVVSAFCDKPGGGTKYNQVFGSTSDLRDLKNCSGDLKKTC